MNSHLRFETWPGVFGLLRHDSAGVVRAGRELSYYKHESIRVKVIVSVGKYQAERTLRLMTPRSTMRCDVVRSLVYAYFPDWLMNEHYRVLFVLASE